MIYVQTNSTSIEAVTTPLEGKADKCAHVSKEGDVDGEVEAAASSFMSKDWDTTMEQLIQKMDSMPSVYKIGFHNFFNEHELGTRKGINEKAYLILVSFFYNFRRN